LTQTSIGRLGREDIVSREYRQTADGTVVRGLPEIDTVSHEVIDEESAVQIRMLKCELLELLQVLDERVDEVLCHAHDHVTPHYGLAA